MSTIENIRTALEGVESPDWVLRLRPELITDAHGDPAVAVWVVIRQGELDEVLKDGSRLNAVRQLIHDAFRDHGIALWPYVRFESEHEIAQRYQTRFMSMTSTLDRILDPVARCLTPEVAEKIATIELEAGISERRDRLATKADGGDLTEEERQEYEELVDGMDLLGILKAQARSILDRRA